MRRLTACKSILFEKNTLNMATIKDFKEFIGLFLEKRTLDAPDGRPLYEYKISDGRYNLLKELLKDRWEETDECYACFVLFAVEFLRAESSEGHLKWEYIFDSIGKEILNRPPSRSEIVETGLKYWKREVFQGQHREYLETLRFESGLPNTCLNNGNNIASLIKSTFQLLESFKLDEEELLSFIEGRVERYPIPLVLCQKNFYGLVTKLCLKFLGFKKDFNLANHTNPTEYLQVQLPDWREQMPIKIQGAQMNNFFNGIISEISKIEKIERKVLQLESVLSETGEEFLINTFITVPKGIHSHESLGIRKDNFDRLPGYFLLKFECEGKVSYITSFTKTSDGKISSRGLEKFILPAEITGKEWSLIYSSEDLESQSETEIAKIFEIPSNEPLIFTEDKGNWIFKGLAPMKIKEDNCRVLFNDSLYTLMNSNIQKTGQTTSGLAIYEVKDDCIIFDCENQTEFWIKLNQETESCKIIEFTHDKQPIAGSFNFLAENKNSFIGLPKIHLFNKKLGLREYFLGDIEVYNVNKKWERLNQNHNFFGKNKFRFTDKYGNIVGLRTLNILPVDFSIGISAMQRTLQINSAKDFKVFFERGGLETQIIRMGNVREIKVGRNDNDSSKTYFNIRLDFGSGNNLELKLPNSNLSEVFVDGQGKVVNREAFSLSKINGLSITVNNFKGVKERKFYTLKLVDIHNPQLSLIEIKKEVFVDSFSSKRLPLYQWVTLINQLFSLTTNTRASVRISSSGAHHYIDINKYEIHLGFDGITGLVSSNIVELDSDLNLSAFRLDEKFKTSGLVDIILNNENKNVMDVLPSEGKWFVYAKADAIRSIFPVVISKGDFLIKQTNGPINYLSEATTLDFDSRIQRFKEYFDNLYLNFEHGVWKELYDLFIATEHLPISALDIWKGLVLSPKGMLTLLLSFYGVPDLIHRVSQELSFMWQMVQIDIWKEVFVNWEDQLNHSEIYAKHKDSLIKDKLLIIKTQLGIKSIEDYLSDSPQKINADVLLILISADINGSEGSMGLRTRHPDGVFWASHAADYIKDKFKFLPVEIRNLIPDGLHSWQKPVAYLPVILGYHSVVGDFISLNEINAEVMLGFKLNIDFDRQYFEDVYAGVQGYCYSQAHLNQID